MASFFIGRVTRQVGPDRCFFAKTRGGALSPGEYVEIVLPDNIRLAGIIEEVTGQVVEIPGKLMVHTRYEYACRVLMKETPHELLNQDVHIPDSKALVALFDPKPTMPICIGEVSMADGHIPVVLKGECLLNTHCCIFGSSGSGKTTFLGLLVEEILLQIPTAQVVILDLNSDFARFDQKRSASEVNSDDNLCEEVKTHALKSQQDMLGNLAIKLIPSPQIRMDRFNHNDLLQMESIPYHFATEQWLELVCKRLSGTGPISPKKCEERLRQEIEHERKFVFDKEAAYPLQEEDLKGRAILHNFFMRIKDAPIWSSDASDSLDILENPNSFRVVQFNLGGLRFAHRAVLAEAVLRKLWDRNEKTKSDTFIVIDEAHNVAPALPEEGWQRRTLEWVNRISGEGRKYGLYLILVSQRPAKIHPNALDNCRNFFILRLQNQDDLTSLSKGTLDVSASLLSRAAAFRRHEALVFGDLGPPAIIRPGRRRMK